MTWHRRTERGLRGLAACLAPLILTACLTDGGEAPVRTVQAPPAAPEAASAPTHSHEAHTHEQLASTPPEPTYPEIDTLKGLASANVEDLLGAPHFRRRDNPAELWQYRGADCVIDLFLYPGNGAPLTVEHLEVRGTAGQTVQRQGCFVSLLTRQGGAEKG